VIRFAGSLLLVCCLPAFGSEAKGWKLIHDWGHTKHVALTVTDKAKAHVADAAQTLCDSKPDKVCMLRIWPAEPLVSQVIWPSETEIDAMTATHMVNRNTGYRATLFNCKLFKGLPSDSCIAGTERDKRRKR
jgi:hypothetical protein